MANSMQQLQDDTMGESTVILERQRLTISPCTGTPVPSQTDIQQFQRAQSITIQDTPEKQRLREELAWTRQLADERMGELLRKTQEFVATQQQQTRENYNACVAQLQHEWEVAMKINQYNFFEELLNMSRSRRFLYTRHLSTYVDIYMHLCVCT